MYGRLWVMDMVDRELPRGTLTLMGSGEMTELLGKVHRRLMSKIGGPVQPVFLDTPAGFQLNCDELSARAIEYFAKRFNVTLEIASLKRAALIDLPEGQLFLERLRHANYVFAGPGSPSYAARNWQESAVGEELQRRLAEGAQLVFASAAATTMGRHTIPVYEIYKVGEDPRWIAGLDLLGPQGFDLAIVPHWNNQEGGTHDTRYCYMGEPRLRILEAQLPVSTVMLGIDEYTACTIDLTNRICEVQGAGGVTIRQRGSEVTFPSGSSFPTAYLVQGPRSASLSPSASPVQSSVRSRGIESDVMDSQPESLETTILPEAESFEDRLDGAFTSSAIQLLVDVRGRLRSERQFDLADEIRRGLHDLGVELEDGLNGTTWSKSD